MADDLIDLSAITHYIDDLGKLPSNLRRKAIRPALNKAKKRLLSAEKRQLSDSMKSAGYVDKYGNEHTGRLRKALKGKIKINNRVVSVSVGLFPIKRMKAMSEYSYDPAHYIGLWLNLGTKAHTIGKRDSRRVNRQTGRMVKGIQGIDWVMKSYTDEQVEIFHEIQAAIEENYDQFMRSFYSGDKT